MITFKNNFILEEELLSQIAKGHEKALEELMGKYIEPLGNYVMSFTGSKDLSEEVVADVFINLWKIRKSLKIKTSLKAYLYRACKNRSFDLLKKEKPYQLDDVDSFDQIIGGVAPDSKIQMDDLNFQINNLISEMPQQKQLIFRMSRIDGLKYSEIAEILSISINTVQNHMVEAIKHMAFKKENLM